MSPHDSVELEDAEADEHPPADLVELHEVLEWQAALDAGGEGDS